MDVEIFSLITFDSTHSAIRAEKELMNNINVRIIPVPREITSGCGLSLNIKTSGYYLIKKIGLSKEVTRYET